MAGNDVFLYQVASDANPNDVRLRDPSSASVMVSDDQIDRDELFFDYGSEDQELSFTFHDGVIADDVIAIVDDPAQGLEWQAEADDDLSYSFTFDIVDDLSDLPFAALAVYEDDDGTDYNFASGAVEDIIILDEPALASLEAAAEYDDENSYSFATDIGDVVAALDEPINNDLPFAYFDYGDDEQDYSFTFGPLADDAIISPIPIVIDDSGHDGKPRKQQHEYAYERYAKRKRELEAIIAKAIGSNNEALNETDNLIYEINTAPATVLQKIFNVVIEYRKLIAQHDLQIQDDQEIAIVMMMIQ